MASLLESIKRKSQIVVTQINTLISAINDKLDMKTGGTIEGNLTVTGNITGTLKGNASSATKLATARTIGISGGATGTATSFDGSGNITIPVTALDVSKATAGTLPIARGGTGASTKNFVDLSSDQTVAGDKTFSGRIIVSNSTDIAGATENSGAFIVGSETGQHLGIDSNEIISKKDGTTTGTLSLQADGGSINCGVNTSLTTFTVNAKSSSFSGTLTVPTLTVSTTLNIPGGKIWIA